MNSAAIPFRTTASRRVLAAGLVWICVYLAARFALDSLAPAHPWGMLIALAPMPAFLLFVRAVHLALKETDELMRRIQLEALAFAFLATIVLMMVLGLLESLPDQHGSTELRNAWRFLPPLYGVGLCLAAGRYR